MMMKKCNKNHNNNVMAKAIYSCDINYWDCIVYDT